MTNLSTDQVIADMHGWTNLKAYFEGARDDIDARLNLAEQKVGDTRRSFHVDQQAGNDASDGTSEAPLASLMEANNRSVWAGVTWVTLVGDYEMRHRFTVKSHALVLKGAGGTLSFAADSLNAVGNQPGFVCNRTSMPDLSVTFDNLTLALPEAPNTEGIFINTGFVRLALRSTTITIAGAQTRSICSGSGAIGIVTSSVSFPAEMAGRWVESVAAGEAPNTARRVAYSSMTTL